MERGELDVVEEQDTHLFVWAIRACVYVCECVCGDSLYSLPQPPNTQDTKHRARTCSAKLAVQT